MKIKDILESDQHLWNPFQRDYPMGHPATTFLERIYKNRDHKLSDEQLIKCAYALAAYLNVPIITKDLGHPKSKLPTINKNEPLPYGLVPKIERHWDTKTLYAPYDLYTDKKNQTRETAEILIHELAHYQTSGEFRGDVNWGLGPVDPFHPDSPSSKVNYKQTDWYEGVSGLLMVCYLAFFGDFEMAFFVLNNYELVAPHGGYVNAMKQYIKTWNWLIKNKLINQAGIPNFHKTPILA